jgi:uncharacterized protein YsxB (DUF464 family)
LITCHIVLSEKLGRSHIVDLQVEGHFLVEKGSMNAACAAMSALIRTYGRQLELFRGLTANIKVDKAGCFRAVIESIDPNASDWYSGVCDFLLCGLGDLMRDYPHEFVMELKRR